VARKNGQATTASAARPELEQSGPVFDRARRLAAALFGRGASADVVLVSGESVWRSCDPEGRVNVDAQGSRAVIASGRLLWTEDLGALPEAQARARDYGVAELGFYVVVPIRLDDGSIPGVLAVGGPGRRPYDAELAAQLQDLADFVADEWTRVRATRARDEARSTLANVMQAAPVWLAVTDRELRLVQASPAWLDLIGATAAGAVGRNVFELAPGMFEPWREVLERGVAGETTFTDKFGLPQPDGGVAWFQSRVAPWRDAAGKVGGVLMVAHDITPLIEAMDGIASSEERLKVATELAKLRVWEADVGQRKLAHVDASGVRSDALKSKRGNRSVFWSDIDPRDRPSVRVAWNRAKAEGSPFRAEYRVRRDGRQYWVACAARTVRDSEGRPARIVGALQDITARKLQEEALIQAKDEAEAANRAKSAFLATVSHEIRTPLNGLMGMAQAMARGPLDPDQRQRLNVIRSSSEGLLSILNELLDLSKIEAGKLTLEEGEFDIAELAEGACATFQAVAENKGLSFGCKVLPSARGRYRGDPMRMRQILHNLTANALKFTERGQVRILVGRRGGVLQIKVVDTGIGMTGAQQKKLFRAFQQAEASTSRRFGGTGLGLAICRELAELMGGRIQVRSAPGEGACFTVSVPLPRVEPTAPAAEAPRTAGLAGAAAERALRVLAAEDNSVNQLVLKTLLHQIGVEPVMVSDGRAAVEAWAREPWDLILMDVQMPVLDGPHAAAEIRAREQAEGRRRTPIVALTANAMHDQVAEYLAAGMDGHVAKPIAASQLFAAVQAALELGDAEPGAEAAA
jgi:PAS domain S-box-containing protein